MICCSNQAVDEVVRAVERRKARPIDPKEASKGRLDYAQVGNAFFNMFRGKQTT